VTVLGRGIRVTTVAKVGICPGQAGPRLVGNRPLVPHLVGRGRLPPTAYGVHTITSSIGSCGLPTAYYNLAEHPPPLVMRTERDVSATFSLFLCFHVSVVREVGCGILAFWINDKKDKRREEGVDVDIDTDINSIGTGIDTGTPRIVSKLHL